MEAWVAAKTCKGSGTVLITGLVEQGATYLFEVELEFLGEDVFDERFDGDIVVTADGGKIRICTRTFG